MSLSKKVAKSIEEMNKKDYGEALYQIVSAIDGTAQAEYGSRGRRSYKRFIHDNLKLITRIGWGTSIENFHLDYPLPEDADVKPSTPEGGYTIQDIIYHAVRCSLTHNSGTLPPNLEFHEGATMDLSEPGKWKLNANFIHGLIVAVVTSPKNASAEEIGDNFGLQLANGLTLPINKLWGKREELIWLLDAIPCQAPVAPLPENRDLLNAIGGQASDANGQLYFSFTRSPI